MGLIFHIAEQTAWSEAKTRGFYEVQSLQREGFIHFSKAEQVERTAARFFKNRRDLVLLKVDDSRLQAELKHEPSDGELFPHLYGRLNVDAVVAATPFAQGEEKAHLA